MYLKPLKTYNPRGYKDFMEYKSKKMREGLLVGEKIGDNKYFCEIEATEIMTFVYGKFGVEYHIDYEDNAYVLDKLCPEYFLKEGRLRYLETYKGIPIIGAREKFKIDFFIARDLRENLP